MSAELKIHLDTDLGGDPDDVCALAMLLGWSGVEITGITTTIDPEGRRASYVRYILSLVDRDDIPVEAGAELSLTTGKRADPVINDERFWPADLETRRSDRGGLELLSRSIEQGATVVAIGPLTNLALLETEKPGSLGKVPVVAMGGWIRPPAPGLPQWGPEMDWNIQWDVNAAEIVGRAATMLTLATLPATMKAQLRAADLPRLRASGPLGELLARQSEIHGHENRMAERASENPALPKDLVNFHWDPVTCAVALGWSGVTSEEMQLEPIVEGDVLKFEPSNEGRSVQVVLDVDGTAFTKTWLTAVEAAQKNKSPTGRV